MSSWSRICAGLALAAPAAALASPPPAPSTAEPRVPRPQQSRPPAPPGADPAAVALTLRIAGAYLNATSMQYSADYTFSSAAVLRGAPRSATMLFSARRPNLLRVEMQSHQPDHVAVMVCDGQTVWEYDADRNEYYNTKAPDGPLLVNGHLSVLRFAPRPMIFDPDPARTLLRGITDAVPLPTTPIDGEPCDGIARKYRHGVNLMWVDRRDALPRRIVEVRLADGAPTEVFRETRSDVRVNVSIPAGEFKFKPPANAKFVRPATAADALLAVGASMPAATFVTAAGAEKSVSAFRGRKTVFIFFSSWSPPSMQEIADAAGLLGSRSPAPAIVAINVWDSGADLGALSRDNRSVVFLRDTETSRHESLAWREFGVRALPTTYVVSADGKVQGAWLGYDGRIQQDVRALLAAP